MTIEKIFNEGFFGAPLRPNIRSLGKQFGYVPFSILDTRQGAWLSRRRDWASKFGLKGELGRVDPDNAHEVKPPGTAYVNDLDQHGVSLRDDFTTREIKARLGDKFDKVNIKKTYPPTGTSVFDPVLCELMYRWFCPHYGDILDPFAGGSTRGVVAEILGYNYCGVELREDQIESNEEQAEKIGVSPKWIHGDSLNLNILMRPNKKFDLIFTSPPYFDLEIYSRDLQADGSTFDDYEKFLKWYKNIFQQATNRLRDNRFAIVVVSEIRDTNWIYRNFVGDTISMFLDIGMDYYNELILINRGGSLPLRTKRQFINSRKIGKVHQNVLVFFKGDPLAIKDEFDGSYKDLATGFEDASE